MAKPDFGEAPAADSTDPKQDLPSAAIADAVAVAIPVTIPLTAAPTDVFATASVAGASSGQGGTAPLAIAAAAIAATASVTGAATAPAIAAATATSSTQDHAFETTAASVAIPDAKPAAMATAAETLTVAVQPTASAYTAAATDVVLAASIAAPVVAKVSATTAKASPVAKNAAQADDQNTTADATDASAATTTTAAASTSAAQPVAAAPRRGETGAGNTVKPDQADGSSSTINAAHGHAVSAEATQTSAGSPTSVPLAPGTMPPPLQPAAATQAASSFNVTAATQATAVPLNGLAMEIAVTASSGKSRFEIRLDPAELGRIDVRIDVDRNGQVTSHLTVEKPETLSMLRQDAPQLQRALNDAGLSTNGGGLQFSLRDQPSSGQNNGNQSNPNAQRLIVSEEDTIAAAAGRSYGRMLSASGGVDIRV